MKSLKYKGLIVNIVDDGHTVKGLNEDIVVTKNTVASDGKTMYCTEEFFERLKKETENNGSEL